MACGAPMIAERGYFGSTRKPLNYSPTEHLGYPSRRLSADRTHPVRRRTGAGEAFTQCIPKRIDRNLLNRHLPATHHRRCSACHHARSEAPAEVTEARLGSTAHRLREPRSHSGGRNPSPVEALLHASRDADCLGDRIAHGGPRGRSADASGTPSSPAVGSPTLTPALTALSATFLQSNFSCFSSSSSASAPFRSPSRSSSCRCWRPCSSRQPGSKAKGRSSGPVHSTP